MGLRQSQKNLHRFAIVQPCTVYTWSRFAIVQPCTVYTWSRFAIVQTYTVYTWSRFAIVQPCTVYTWSRFAIVQPCTVYTWSRFAEQIPQNTESVFHPCYYKFRSCTECESCCVWLRGKWWSHLRPERQINRRSSQFSCSIITGPRVLY